MKIIILIFSAIFIIKGTINLVTTILFKDKVRTNFRKYTVIILQKDSFFKIQFYYFIVTSLLTISLGIILIFIHDASLLFIIFAPVFAILNHLYIKTIKMKEYVELK